jgi:hypothetical protein
MANQLANQPTGTVINSNKQVNMYNNQQNATIHKDNSKDFFWFVITHLQQLKN